jgi:Tfp pilus assembly protein PilN
MRPINLIPAEERRRNRGVGSRSGPLPFMLVGALALALIGVVMLLHYSHQVSDREDEIANLQAKNAAASAHAEQLAPYTSFAQMAEQRTSTIAQLADARFDWSRVIKQLSTILPHDVYFTNLSGSAGGATTEGTGVGAPSLSIQGCASSQDSVAVFVATLKQIDGVTRVSLETSKLGEGEQSGASACSVGNKATFSILVVFDGAPASPDSGEFAVPGTESSEGEGESESSGSESESSSEEPSEPESSEGESSTQSASTGEGGAAG